MFSANLGDLAQAFMLRRQTSAASTELNRLTAEMSSGRKEDLQSHLRGQFTPLAGIERARTMNATYAASNKAAAQFANAQQLALDAVQSSVVNSGADFLRAATQGDATQRQVTYANASSALTQVIDNLNGHYGSRALFAGAATQGPALVDAAQLLSDLGAAVAGQTTASGVLAAADAWFDTPGGGFDTLAYIGSTTPLSPFDIAEGSTERLDTTAADPAIRDTLKGLALAAMMDQGLLSGSPAEQQRLLQSAGARLVNTGDDLTALRAGIGFAEERIETARVRGEAEATGLETALNALVQADPYATAIALQNAQTRIETIYTITARVSGLSLAAVLR
ncbi:MAG: hypothetical protein KDA73_02470 [Rhodobacteraceae bacterium]|nr:hypothetical protein [Paracoccaceae bacterium]